MNTSAHTTKPHQHALRIVCNFAMASLAGTHKKRARAWLVPVEPCPLAFVDEQDGTQGAIMAETKEVSPAAPGDDRTPDKTIGEVKYARGQSKKSKGGAGEPEVTDLEPEKQGGIGGP